MHFFVIKRQTVIGILAFVTALALSILTLGSSSDAQSVFWSSQRKLPIYCVERGEEKVVSLTFDAAWGADKTEDILALLKQYDAKGTFFVVGFWAEKYQDKLVSLRDSGIEIGTHSNTHPHMAKLSESKIELELTSSMSSIERITGKKPSIFRPPFGEYSDTLLNVAERLGLATIQWDVDSLDWKDLSAREIAERVLNRVKCGSVVLMHNDATHIVDGLRLILEGLKQREYRAITVSEMIYKDNYRIDNSGKQIKV